MVDASGPFPMELSKPVVCIVGPTASGKTDVAQLVAQHFGGEVISADSMQVYRGMDIGTGKIPVEDRIVTHHGFDLVDPGEPYSAALFQSYARNLFHVLDSRGSASILAGGTGLYVRAAIDDYSFPSGEQLPEDNPVRAHYSAFAEEHGGQALWDLLNKRDPESASLIHPNNVKRTVRAFELLEIDNTTYAKQHAGFETMRQFVPAAIFHLDVDPVILASRIDRRVEGMLESGLIDEIASLIKQGFMRQFVPAAIFHLDVDPVILASRIDRRVEGMLESGLIDEIASLIKQGFMNALTAKEAIGYKEFLPYIVGGCQDRSLLEAAKDQVKTATRRYAKRQRTWWRNDARVIHVSADSGDAHRIADAVIGHLKQDGFGSGSC